MRILFVDAVCYKPYSLQTLNSGALGGTEATVLRVAKGLSTRGHDVFIFQFKDDEREETDIEGIRHIGANSLIQAPDVVVHIRTAKGLAGFREHWPKARHVVWMHDLGGEWLKDEPLSSEEVICLSDFHVKQFLEECTKHGLSDVKATRIYYPIEVQAKRPILNEVLPNRLGFFSSPHKGIGQCINAFYDMRAKNKKLEFVYCNPGYMNDWPGGGSLINLGQLSHSRVLEEMAKCQMLFYPQTVFPETFGRIYAEANTMGLPVLCHDFGAAREILSQGNEVIDCASPQAIAAAFERLMTNRPAIHPRPEFNPEVVLDAWESYLKIK